MNRVIIRLVRDWVAYPLVGVRSTNRGDSSILWSVERTLPGYGQIVDHLFGSRQEAETVAGAMNEKRGTLGLKIKTIID